MSSCLVVSLFVSQNVLCTIRSESFPSSTRLALIPICSSKDTSLWRRWLSTWVNKQFQKVFLNHCIAPPPHCSLVKLSFCPPDHKADASKHGMMKFREERSILGMGVLSNFHDKYFILNSSSLRMYKEVRVRLTETHVCNNFLHCHSVQQTHSHCSCCSVFLRLSE